MQRSFNCTSLQSLHFRPTQNAKHRRRLQHSNISLRAGSMTPNSSLIITWSPDKTVTYRMIYVRRESNPIVSYKSQQKCSGYLNHEPCSNNYCQQHSEKRTKKIKDELSLALHRRNKNVYILNNLVVERMVLNSHKCLVFILYISALRRCHLFVINMTGFYWNMWVYEKLESSNTTLRLIDGSTFCYCGGPLGN